MVTTTSSTSHLHMPQKRKEDALFKEKESEYIFSVNKKAKNNHVERYLRIPQPRNKGLETDKEEQNLDERLGLHQHKLVKDMLACLIGCTASVEHTTALLKAGKLLVKHIKTLNDLNIPYRLVDISDKDVYKNFGLIENLEYDFGRRTFVTGDPKFEDQYETNENAKMLVDYSNQYVLDRKDYLTSIFPDIVL